MKPCQGQFCPGLIENGVLPEYRIVVCPEAEFPMHCPWSAPTAARQTNPHPPIVLLHDLGPPRHAKHLAVTTQRGTRIIRWEKTIRKRKKPTSMEYVIKFTASSPRLIHGAQRWGPALRIFPKHVYIARLVTELDQIRSVIQPKDQADSLVFKGQQIQPLPPKKTGPRTMAGGNVEICADYHSICLPPYSKTSSRQRKKTSRKLTLPFIFSRPKENSRYATDVPQRSSGNS